MNTRILLLGCFVSAFIQAQAQQTHYNNGRMLTELNTLGTADAYPWISPDGLRLYYTKEVAGQDKTYFAERPSFDEDFGTPTDLFPLFADPQFSPWLSANELEIWFESYGTLMHATRASISDPFGTLTEVELIPNITSFKSPTFTPDGGELYIYDQGITRRYENTGPDSYTFVDALDLGLTDMKTFKLDVSGTAGYFAIESGAVHIPFRTIRASLDDSFTSYQALSGTVIPGGSWIQQHITEDSTRLFMVSSDDTWASNELYEAWGTAVSVSEVQQNDGILCWPSPASEEVNVLLPNNAAPYAIQLFDAAGRCAYASNARAGGLVTIDMRSMPSGSYHMVIVSNERSMRSAVSVVH